MKATEVRNKILDLEAQLEQTQKRISYWKSQLEYIERYEESVENVKESTRKFNEEIVEGINKGASEFYGRQIDIRSKNREREFVYPRHFYCFYMNNKYGSTLSFIGKSINRNHATVINGIKNHRDLMATGEFEYVRLIDKLQNFL